MLTTVRDPAVVERMTRVLEAAYAHFAAMIPSPSHTTAVPMDVLLFETPEEWENYTIRLTGKDAPIYLSVGSGGYTYQDKVVCWLYNEADLWGVVAHEAFHQYIARALPLRLPPALEEGLATTFETVEVSERQVTIDRRANTRRQRGLVDANTAAVLMPLADFVRAHAGDVAGRDQVVREGFYAQGWALARLLLEQPKYAVSFRRMVEDLRNGRASPVVGRVGVGTDYFPGNIRPFLEQYLPAGWAAFDIDYRDWVANLAKSDSEPR